MSEVEQIQPPGEKMRRVLLWISETVKSEPTKSRNAILKEAEIRFDLSPRECEFLDTFMDEEM